MTATFGSALREYRIAHGLTQEALAERALLSPTAIAALERGRNRSPRMSTLQQLAKALELDPEEMAGLARTLTTTRPLEPSPAATLQARSGEESLERPSPGPEVMARASLPPAAGRRWRTEFIGRTDETASLRQSLAEGCRLIEVVGESGIGKTRLVAEMARDIGRFTVAWGRCSQDNLGSYLPFIEIIRHLSDQLSDAELKALLGGQGELTRLMPELSTRIDALSLPARAEADSEQRMLFEAVSGFLSHWCPMVLVLDDLHWADTASLSLLSYLVRDYSLSNFVAVATFRPIDLNESARGLLAQLGRDVDAARIRLDPLTSPEIAQLIADLVGSDPPQTLIESVESATDGNPLFTEELIAHLLDTEFVVDPVTGRVRPDGSNGSSVPQRIRDMVASRLLSLSSDGRELLIVGAVIGREFELSVVGSALSLSESAVVDAADDALLSGMVVELGPGRLGFSHGLLRDAVVERLSNARKVVTHRSVAMAMEEQPSSSVQRAAALARHWAVVAEVDATASVAAATWAVRAGDQALAAAAAEEAIARYEQAVALWASASVGHIDSLIRLGVALHYRGRADDADEKFKQAITLAVGVKDPILQARAAIGYGRRYPYWETDSGRLTALEAALRELPLSDVPLRTMLQGLLVTHLINGFAPHEAARRDNLAAEISSLISDPATPDDVLLAAGQTRVYDCIEDPVVLNAVSDRLLALAVTHNDLKVEATACFSKALSALDQGHLDVLRASSERYDGVSARLDDPREMSQAATVRSTIAFLEGRYDVASDLSDEALVLGQKSGDFNAELIHYAQGLLRAIDQGLAREVLPLLLASTEYQVIASFDAGTALCAALAGDRDEAAARLTRLTKTGFPGAPRGADYLAPTAFLSHVAVLVEDIMSAETLYGWMARTRATVVRIGPVAGGWGPVDHHLGCLAHMLGRHEEAEGRLRHALEIERSMRARPFAARTLAHLAVVVAARSREDALTVARDATNEAEALGAEGVVAEVADILDDHALTRG
jgi:transcriptional regulator with XRE-family HTH domain/tetratricopeptide (TPR) repeat protein